MGEILRRSLIRLSVPLWLIAAGLVIMRVVPWDDKPDGTLVVLAAALAITGTLLAGQQRNRPRDPVRLLLDALTDDDPAVTDAQPAGHGSPDLAA